MIAAGAALALSSTPAAAQLSVPPTTGWAAPSGPEGHVRVHRDRRHGNGRHHRHHRNSPYGTFGYGVPVVYSDGAWALYNNRGWESDSFNDWFHDRPDRALPRWVRNNRNCERQYWSGGGWTC
jgi:hypothetical protein